MIIFGGGGGNVLSPICLDLTILNPSYLSDSVQVNLHLMVCDPLKVNPCVTKKKLIRRIL